MQSVEHVPVNMGGSKQIDCYLVQMRFSVSHEISFLN